jgi:hypothetical protein
LWPAVAVVRALNLTLIQVEQVAMVVEMAQMALMAMVEMLAAVVKAAGLGVRGVQES